MTGVQALACWAASATEGRSNYFLRPTHKPTCLLGLLLVNQTCCSFLNLRSNIAGLWPVGTSFLVGQDGCVGGCCWLTHFLCTAGAAAAGGKHPAGRVCSGAGRAGGAQPGPPALQWLAACISDLKHTASPSSSALQQCRTALSLPRRMVGCKRAGVQLSPGAHSTAVHLVARRQAGEPPRASVSVGAQAGARALLGDKGHYGHVHKEHKEKAPPPPHTPHPKGHYGPPPLPKHKKKKHHKPPHPPKAPKTWYPKEEHTKPPKKEHVKKEHKEHEHKGHYGARPRF